ncbi:MAG: AraC family transcriptional regulator [Caldilineaceae bacterium]
MNTNHTLDPILKFIEEHLDQPLAVDELAQRAHLSRYHFIRRFQRAFHQTPHQYVINRRLAKAKELLAHSTLSVTEICFAVGFESLGSFSTLFRNSVGWSPSIYRARVLEQRRNPYKFIPGCMCLMYGLSPSAEERNFQEAKTEQTC